MRIKDIQIGETYLGLKVLKDLGGKGTKHKMLVQCMNCGKEYSICAYDIGVTKKCFDCSRRTPDLSIVGKRFNSLVVLGYAERRYNPRGTVRSIYKCKCDCGNEVFVDRGHLLAGAVSCGCQTRKRQIESKTKHNITLHSRGCMEPITQ